MVFSSYLFLFFFLPAALLGYYLARGRWKPAALTLASAVFYGWANPWFLLLMAGTITVDFANGRLIGVFPARKRWFLAASLLFDLGMLAIFKYFNFGIENYNALMTSLGIPAWQYAGFFRIVLPLGISFYTFQSLSYVIDVYRGDERPVRGWLEYACYVSMFPQLVAGPIVRLRDIRDRLECPGYSAEEMARGVALLMLGLGKKVLLANPCGKIADLTFGALDLSVLDAWFGVVAYAFQIYFDFSGYSDMALGLGLLLGFRFPQNFNSPFRSHSITEFWARWHMTLSGWLRDYLYIPLGGNRKGAFRTCVNIMTVMLLGGLWHGAGWSYLFWGTWQGAGLVLERLNGKRAWYCRLPGWLQVAATFVVLLPGWVFFRAATLPDACRYLGSMAGLNAMPERASVIRGILYNPYYLTLFLIAAVVVWACPGSWTFTQKLPRTRLAWCFAVFLAAVAILATQSYNPFIYFIF